MFSGFRSRTDHSPTVCGARCSDLSALKQKLVNEADVIKYGGPLLGSASVLLRTAGVVGDLFEVRRFLGFAGTSLKTGRAFAMSVYTSTGFAEN